MSKVDAQRAMREARFAAYREKVAAEARAAAATPVRPAAPPKPPAAPEEPGAAKGPEALEVPEALETSPEGADPDAGLCGHRNMSNKTCRRVAGHPEKNHRYT